jgi:predicted DsbA family dithiol-disulfide isomerase
MTSPLIVDVVADVVCPWCYLGWRRVKAAVALRPAARAQLVWRPYQLDPSIPEAGTDRKAYLAAKFRDPERLRQVHDALVSGGAEDGITFRFDLIEKSPNTNAAHRLIRWAFGAGVQDLVVEALFAAYFTEGRDIGDPMVLADIAGKAGMERLTVLQLLSEDADKAAVDQEHSLAVQGGVTGVPFVIFGGKVAVVGAEAPEHVLRALDQAMIETA